MKLTKSSALFMNIIDKAPYLVLVIRLKKGRKTSHHGPDIVGYRRAAYA
jgi:hypothetical protein